ncbi:MAG TPA: DUF6089 family protein [Chryseolinea sp.]|nr:DUF6089 family protein [Chryseolinea sp.]
MRKFFQIALAVLLISFVYEADAQISRRSVKKNNRKMSSYRGRKSWFGKEKRYNMLGLSVSALNYYGDLSPKPTRFSTDISFTRPALGLVFAHRFGPRYALTGSFMYGTLKGSDSESADQGDTSNGVYRYQRNLSFRNRIKELSVVASFDLFPNSATYISRVKWTPYAFLGAAAMLHNPQAIAPAEDLKGNPLPDAGKWVDLKPLGTEGQNAQLLASDANSGIKDYKKLQVAIPFGIGVRFKINEIFDFSIETGFRYLFTDYIDDVSSNYVDLGVFGNDELAKAMSYRSNEIATPTTTYTARDGQSYAVLSGYGSEMNDNVRGSKNQKDIYMVTTLKITYILGKSMLRAKFR